MTKRFIRFSFVFIALMVLVIVQNSYAQNTQNIPVTQKTKESKPQIKYEDITDITKLVDKSEVIKKFKDSIEQRIKELSDITDIEKKYESYNNSFYQYKKSYSDKSLTNNIDIDSIVELKMDVTTITSYCSDLKDIILKKIEDLDKYKKDWNLLKDEWKWLKKNGSLANTSQAKYVFDEFEKENQVNKYIENTDKLLEDADKPLIKINEKISELNLKTIDFSKELDEFIKKLRSRLFHKSHNAMFSSKYFTELHKFLTQKSNDLNSNKKDSEDIFDNYGWLFLLQIAVFTIVLLYLKNANINFWTNLGLGFLHKNYICSSIIISVLFGIPFFFENFPINIKLIYTIFLCIATGIIIYDKISNKSIKAGIALVFILYILYKIFDLADIPDVISRPVLAFISLAAGLYFFYIDKVNNFFHLDYENTQNQTNIKIKLFNIILGVFLVLAFILQIAGYTALANHIFHITLKSVLIALLAWIALGFLKGCVKIALTNLFVDKYLKSVVPDVSSIINNCNTVVTLLVMFFVVSAILTAWGFYDNIIESSRSILTLGFTIHGLKITFGNFCLAVLLFSLILSISWLVRSILDVNFYPKRNIESGVAISINRLIYYSFIVIAIAVAMGVLGISIQSLMVVIGALGVGIGFGLQNIVNNFASGLILLFERSIKVGDIIVVNGTWGTVKHLGLRATIIQTFANAEMIVPNSDLVSSTVNNWTMTNRQTRFTVKVGVAYGTDTKLVKDVLLKIASNHSNVLKEPAPSVVFTEFGDSSLNFELRCWVKDISSMWKTQDEIMYEVDNEFKNNNISIPFPQRDLYIKEMPSSMKEEVNNDKKSSVNKDEVVDGYKPSIFPETSNSDDYVKNEENDENKESDQEFKNKKKDKHKHRR